MYREILKTLKGFGVIQVGILLILLNLIEYSTSVFNRLEDEMIINQMSITEITTLQAVLAEVKTPIYIYPEIITIKRDPSDVLLKRTSSTVLDSMRLPSYYYPDMDFSFTPYMDYRTVTNSASSAYSIINHIDSYTDGDGFRRKAVSGGEFSFGEDDYMVAMGTYYLNGKDVAGDRFMVITSTNKFTVIVGDVKDNQHTDAYNMVGIHENGVNYSLLEFIVDTKKIDPTILLHGTVSKGTSQKMSGDIIAIYKI